MSRRFSAAPGRTMSILLSAVIAALALALPGAAYASDPGAQALPPGSAWLRVGHFVPGMGATTIEVQPLAGTGDPMAIASGATYGKVSSYEKLAPGSYTATVRESAAAPDSTPMLSRSFEVTSGQSRTLAVVGTSSAPRLSLLTDDLTLPAPGTARVRLLSASATAGPLTVTAIDGPTIASGAVLGEATDYAVVPAGTWRLQVQGADPTSALNEVAIGSGSVYTVVVLDDANTADSLQVIVDAAGAVVAPKGGAKTGLGGLAVPSTPAHTETSSASVVNGAGAMWATLLLGGVAMVLLARRRAGSGR